MNQNDIEIGELNKTEQNNQSNNVEEDSVVTSNQAVTTHTTILNESSTTTTTTTTTSLTSTSTSISISNKEQHAVESFSDAYENSSTPAVVMMSLSALDTQNTNENVAKVVVADENLKKEPLLLTTKNVADYPIDVINTVLEKPLDQVHSCLSGNVRDTAIAMVTPITSSSPTLSATSSASSVGAASVAVAVAVADMPHLHHAASAPTLGGCAPSRINKQQQQKIKSYHDAKQTALWDTRSSTSSGGAILKSGICSAYGSPRLPRKSSDSSTSSIMPRRVSFPKSDSELVTGYLEPADPWEHVASVNNVNEIIELYEKSCHKHKTEPLPEILDHLKTVELTKLQRQPLLSLKSIKLSPGDCEALEEVLKRVQYKSIDLSSCELEECTVSAVCEIIGYYEAANELNMSTNPKGMTSLGWSSCAYLIGHSQELQIFKGEGNPISTSTISTLGNSLSTSNLHTIKLEHCGLKGQPLNILCLRIRSNRVLKELWMAHNDLDYRDAEHIAELLKINHYLEFVDISNNNIGDEGLKHIVEALIIQSKELERRSMLQRTAAIEDDIFSPVELTSSVDLTQKPESSTSSEELTVDISSSIVDENATKNNILIPDLDTLSIEFEAASLLEPNVLPTTEENEAEDDTEDTVKSNTIKSKQHSSSVCGGGQSMLDKLLSMNSDSSSEEGASNISTDTIAACGSDDTSFVSDDIFDVATLTSTTNTCTNSKAIATTSTTTSTATSIATATATSTATATTLLVPITAEAILMPFEYSAHICADLGQQQQSDQHATCGEKNIQCDKCTLEANNQCECDGNTKARHTTSATTLNCSHNNYNNNIHNNNNHNNNNNNNPHIVQNQQNDFKESSHNNETGTDATEHTKTNNTISSHAASDVFEVTAEESDCLVPCTSSSKQNILLLQNSTSAAVDVNKNTRLGEDYDDTTDSAFESASEGDISRHLPEDFTRFSASLESTRLDDIAKELAIETATIATESTECLVEADVMPAHLPTIAKIGTQKSDEIKTKDVEVRFADTLETMEPDEPSHEKIVGNTKDLESTVPKVTIDPEAVVCVKRSEEHSSPIPTPPPPSTSPGGIGMSMRRTDSSCNFITQSTRNHSQSSDSLCSDNSLDGSVSSDLNLSTSSQLNEKFTKNDTLTRQQRQNDTTMDCGIRAPGGLKALAVWNNNLSNQAGYYISDMLTDTISLELLNIGKNCLSNEFLFRVKDSLTKNTTLTTLGLQSAHLSEKGIETLSSILSFGGNSTLQRIDIRDNRVEVESLTTLAEALKSNKTVTQIDIDDEPKRLSIGSDAHLDYTRVVENVRSMCSRNEKMQSQIQAEKSLNSGGSSKRRGGYYVGSRKISLTCHSRPLIDCSVAHAVTMPPPGNKLEVKRKTGVRLRSPVPSPPIISPSSSPNRSRFQVIRVNEDSPLTSPLAQTPPASTISNNVPIPTLSKSVDSHPQRLPSSSLPSSLNSLTTSTSLPSMATMTPSTQTVKRHSASPRSRFHVSKIFEDPKGSFAKRSLPTPPINLPPTPMMKSAPKHECFETDSDNNENNSTNSMNSTKNNTQTPSNSKYESANIPIHTTQSSESGEQPLLRCPIAVFNENDITLTHDTAKEILSTTVSSIASTNEAKNKDDVDSTITAPPNTQQVARKSSWIGNSTPVDRLLVLFNNPGTIFQRSSSPETKISSTTIPATTTATTSTTTTGVGTLTENTNLIGPTAQDASQPQLQQTIVPTLKQSPQTWSKLGSDILNLSVGEVDKTLIAEPRSFLNVASKHFLDFGKQVFRQTGTTATENNASSSENIQSAATTSATSTLTLTASTSTSTVDSREANNLIKKSDNSMMNVLMPTIDKNMDIAIQSSSENQTKDDNMINAGILVDIKSAVDVDAEKNQNT